MTSGITHEVCPVFSLDSFGDRMHAHALQKSQKSSPCEFSAVIFTHTRPIMTMSSRLLAVGPVTRTQYDCANNNTQCHIVEAISSTVSILVATVSQVAMTYGLPLLSLSARANPGLLLLLAKHMERSIFTATLNYQVTSDCRSCRTILLTRPAMSMRWLATRVRNLFLDTLHAI